MRFLYAKEFRDELIEKHGFKDDLSFRLIRTEEVKPSEFVALFFIDAPQAERGWYLFYANYEYPAGFERNLQTIKEYYTEGFDESSVRQFYQGDELLFRANPPKGYFGEIWQT